MTEQLTFVEPGEFTLHTLVESYSIDDPERNDPDVMSFEDWANDFLEDSDEPVSFVEGIEKVLVNQGRFEWQESLDLIWELRIASTTRLQQYEMERAVRIEFEDEEGDEEDKEYQWLTVPNI